MRKLLFVVGILFAVHADGDTFKDWKKTWDEKERSSALASYEKRIGTEGLRSVYLGLQNDVMAVAATTEQEREWKSSFECVMHATLIPGETTARVEEAMALSPEGQITGSSREQLKKAADTDALLRGDPFTPIEARMTPQYHLFMQGHRLLDPECPNHEIVIEPNSPSVTARELYRISDILSQSLQSRRLPLMESTAAAIHESRTRWDAFFKNAMLDQFPWETYANEFGRHWLQPLRGTLSQPPSAQLRIAHPTPVVVVDDSDGTSFEPSLGIEALGWRAYDEKTYKPRWGASLVAVLKTESQNSTGYGVLLVAKSFSIGAIVRDTKDEKNDVQLMLGVDIAKLFNNQSSAPAARATEVEKAWKGVLGCAVNGFATCNSP